MKDLIITAVVFGVGVAAGTWLFKKFPLAV